MRLFYLILIVYIIFTFVSFYCWWEGFSFPIMYNTTKLQRIGGNLFYLPIISSIGILVKSLLNKKRLLIKFTILFYIIIFNLALYISGDLYKEWYDLGGSDYKNNVKSEIVISQVYCSGIDTNGMAIDVTDFREVKKTVFLKYFCLVKDINVNPPSSNYSSKWISSPVFIENTF
jgi:hypothetical protein